MFYNLNMDAVEKLGFMTDGMAFEQDGEPRSLPGLSNSGFSVGGVVPVREPVGHYQACPAGKRTEDIPVINAAMPGGKRIVLLKTMQTTACERDCYYCGFRAGHDKVRRSTLTPDDLAQAFMRLHERQAVEGLFLSSGIAGGGLRTQDRLIATAEILRKKLGFKGYLHLKIMPGVEYAQVEKAMQLASRVSINLEAPNADRLGRLAPHKIFIEELLQPLKWVDEIRRYHSANKSWNGYWPSITTQFVVGAVGESDLELLQTTAQLNQQVHLARAYFSSFSPIENTPLENVPPGNPWREHRLYQASFLLRDYGFDLEELPFAGEGNLPLETDPKLAWARANLAQAPLEINRAERRDLLRIPGVGQKTANGIIATRRKQKITGLDDLRNLGIPLERAAPFLLVNGKKIPYQLSLIPQ